MDKASQPRLRFNCFLLREGLDDPEHALAARYRSSGSTPLDVLSPSANAPSGARAYFESRATDAPQWAREMGKLFPGAEQAAGVTNRLIVMLPVGERWFALCFGYGSSVLEWSAIEANFGLRYAARVFKDDEIREVRSRRIDASARTQQIQTASGATLGDLDARLEGEFVRRLVGKLAADDEALAVAGGALVASDSVSFRADVELDKIVTTLSSMVNVVATSEAQEEFAFVDALEPLRASATVTRELEDTLAKLLRKSEHDEASGVATLEFAFPDIVGTDDVETIQVIRRAKEATMEEFSLDGLQAAIRELGGRFGRDSLRSVKLIALDDNGAPVSPMLPLRDWLVFEVRRGLQQYILTLGRWFALKLAFSDKLNRDLERIKDVTDTLDLPEWHVKGEAAYNESVAGPDWVMLDRVDLRVDGDEIEACDLFSAQGHLVHVKSYTGSQTLSHLFAQGYVSVTVLNGSDDYKRQFVQAVGERNPAFATVAEEAPQHVVYAIGAPAHRRIPLDLPTFSRVNLRDYARRVRAAGASVAIAHIVKPN